MNKQFSRWDDMSMILFLSVPFFSKHQAYISSSIALQAFIQSSSERKVCPCAKSCSRFQHFSRSIYLQCTVCMQLIEKLHERSRVLTHSCRFCKADPVLAKVEHCVVSSHEDIPKNPAMVHMQTLRLRWGGRGKISRYDAMLCFTPDRTTRGWYVECHEPTDADSLPSLIQLHNVLNTSFTKFENVCICSNDCVIE